MTKKLTLVLISCLVSLLLAEFVLRYIGYPPYQLPEISFESTPTSCFGKDSLGLVLIPGRFEVNIGNVVKYRVTHNSDSNRTTSMLGIANSENPRIDMYGCSYAYGQGVDDEQTYPYLLQSRFPNFTVVNHSVPGYGTLQAYMTIKTALEKGVEPQLIILNYAYFHEERNVLSTSYQYRLYEGFQAFKSQNTHFMDWEDMVYPYVELESDSFKIGYRNVVAEFHHLPLVEKSSIMNRLEEYLTFRTNKDIAELKSSKVLIEQIDRLCTRYNVTFIVAEVDALQKPTTMADFCASKRINYVNICPDFSKESYRISNIDPHPNASAHKIYTERMTDYLNKKELIESATIFN